MLSGKTSRNQTLVADFQIGLAEFYALVGLKSRKTPCFKKIIVQKHPDTRHIHISINLSITQSAPGCSLPTCLKAIYLLKAGALMTAHFRAEWPVGKPSTDALVGGDNANEPSRRIRTNSKTKSIT